MRWNDKKLLDRIKMTEVEWCGKKEKGIRSNEMDWDGKRWNGLKFNELEVNGMRGFLETEWDRRKSKWN